MKSRALIRKYLFLPLIALAIHLTSALAITELSSPSQTQSRGSTSLRNYLAMLGSKHDRFFTLESVPKQQGEINTIPTTVLLEPTGDDDLTEALEQLKANVVNLEYEADKANPRIIHVIDSRLRFRNGYAIERTVKDVDFSGTLDELVSTLGKMGIPVSFPRGAPIGESRDFSTTVHVEGHGLTVRDALTNFLPLAKKKLLWVATTSLADGAVSEVYYP